MIRILEALRAYWKESEGLTFPWLPQYRRSYQDRTRSVTLLLQHLLENGVELIKIKELLGHDNIMVYLHLANTTTVIDQMSGICQRTVD